MIKYNYKPEQITEYAAGYNIDDAKIKLKRKKIIKLASNENPYKTPKKLISFLKKELKNIHLYPDQNYKSIKKALGDNLKLNADEIILGNGSDEILDLIFKALINPKDKVLLFNPSFSVYTILSDIYKAKPITINLKNFQYNINNILKKISPSIKLVILCNPNNPTGTYLNNNDLLKLINKLSSKTTLCIDEAYYNYVTSNNFPDTVSIFKKIKNKKNIIVTRTFSKIYAMAGLRIGYGFAVKNFINLLNKLRIPFNINNIGEKAAIFSLSQNEYINKIKMLNNENKLFLYSELDKLNLSYISSEANFILIKTPVTGKIIFNKLLNKGIIVRPFENTLLKNYLRITIGTKKEIKILITKLKLILNS